LAEIGKKSQATRVDYPNAVIA